VSPEAEPRPGLLVVDKPAGLTSHAVVGRVRRLLGTRRVGHAGTLDPMATGVLVLGVGRGTRLLHYVVGADKEYEATVRLGASTTTDDAEGETVRTVDTTAVQERDVTSAVAAFVGEIDQVPSAVSAIKVDGRRAYARVRAGEDVALAARRVTVSRFDILDVRRVGGLLDVDVWVACSSGTYVRALARDLGATLGVGGHLTALRRTRVGPFTLGEALALDEVGPSCPLIDLGAAASMVLPVRTLDPDEAQRARHGVAPGPSHRSGPVALLDRDGSLVAVGEDAGPRADLRAVFVG
jgi:tRNA pseudouridine55 synthase